MASYREGQTTTGGISIIDDKVIINFGMPVEALSFTPDEAIHFTVNVLVKAYQAKGVPVPKVIDTYIKALM